MGELGAVMPQTPAANRSGFTIIELLIVIVVIGILAAITIIAYNGVQIRARDATRKADIAAIQKYVELYIADNGTPPDTVSACWAARSLLTSGCEAFNSLRDISKYVQSGKLPIDPLNTSEYNYQYRKGALNNNGVATYTGATSKNYVIVTRMEGDTSSFSFSSGTYNYTVGN